MTVLIVNKALVHNVSDKQFKNPCRNQESRIFEFSLIDDFSQYLIFISVSRKKVRPMRNTNITGCAAPAIKKWKILNRQYSIFMKRQKIIHQIITIDLVWDKRYLSSENLTRILTVRFYRLNCTGVNRVIFISLHRRKYCPTYHSRWMTEKCMMDQVGSKD